MSVCVCVPVYNANGIQDLNEERCITEANNNNVTLYIIDWLYRFVDNNVC